MCNSNSRQACGLPTGKLWPACDSVLPVPPTVHFLCLQEQEVSLEAELARLEDEVAALDWGAPGKCLQAVFRFVGSQMGSVKEAWGADVLRAW